MMLARLARMDPTLLHPVNTAARRPKRICCSSSCATVCCVPGVALISAVRFTLKSLGHPVSNPSSERFHKLVLDEVAESIGEMIANNVAAIAELTQRIKALDVSISPLAAERYPETIYLQQVGGVGPIISLYFVLKVGNPGRFQRTRDIGAFLGLCPKRDQSGETDKQLRISKCGDQYLRRLLVSAAQYILGPFGAASALREHGLRLAREGGTAKTKKRAVVAVRTKARRILLITLWKSREPYESFPPMA